MVKLSSLWSSVHRSEQLEESMEEGPHPFTVGVARVGIGLQVIKKKNPISDITKNAMSK